jgi:hypothetical protein
MCGLILSRLLVDNCCQPSGSEFVIVLGSQKFRWEKMQTGKYILQGAPKSFKTRLHIVQGFAASGHARTFDQPLTRPRARRNSHLSRERRPFV